MALLKTAEFLGIQPIPTAGEAGDIREVFIKWDTTATVNGALAVNDAIQLMRVPVGSVISNIRVTQLTGSVQTATIAVGVVPASTSTPGVSPDTVATLTAGQTYNASVAPALNTFSNSTGLVALDTASNYNDRNVIAVITTAAVLAGTASFGFLIQYRPARYGI